VTVVPEGLDIARPVALLTQGRTAMGLAREARLAPGECVLVDTAGGGVGSLLVQIARSTGAGPVIAATRGAPKLDLARRLGADVAVDYGQRD
jgi:NADPH2:quinone reductase